MIDKELNKFNFVPLNEYNFVGRTEYSNEISKKLGNTPKNDHKNTLIVGTSGIGKTALAIMDNNKNQYNSTYFFISKNKEILNKDYRLFAMSVKLEVEKKQDQEVIEIVKGYLFRNNGWLLVYDNVDKPKMSKNDLEQYNGNGHIIITSQNSSGWLELLVIKLGKLKREESKNLFNNLKKIDDSVNADILSDLIEDYPTCIFQLGMHIRNYYDWYDFLQDNDVAIAAISDFITKGAICIKNAPCIPGSLEDLSPRLGPIREVLFERIHNVSVDGHIYNIAHTYIALLTTINV